MMPLNMGTWSVARAGDKYYAVLLNVQSIGCHSPGIYLNATR